MTDSGHAGVEFALAVGVLLFPVALVVTAFGPWSERRVEAEAMAAEAARAVVLELDHSSGQTQLIADAGTLNIDLSHVRAGWCGASPSPMPGPAGLCPLTRGSVVSVTVELWTPLISTPWGPVGGLWATADHTEPIDLYRSLG